MAPQSSRSVAPRSVPINHRQPWFVRRLQRNDRSLKDLDLTKHEVPHHTALSLAESLKENNKLQGLWLQNSKIDDSVVKVLARSLSENKTLETLVLAQNEITDEGMIALAEALEVNESLKMLSVWENRITDKGVERLAEALRVNRSLEKLWMSENRITDAGAKALVRSLHENESLERISLENSDVTLPMRSRLETLLLDRNSRLELLQDTTNSTTEPDSTSSTDDSESENFQMPEKSRAEIEYEIKCLTEFCDSSRENFDEDTWKKASEAEKQLACLKGAVSAGNHPSAEELQDTLKDIEVSLNDMSPSDPKSFPLVRKRTFVKKQLDRELEKERELHILQAVQEGRKHVVSALEASDPATIDGRTQTSIVPTIPMEYLATVTGHWRNDAVIDHGGNGNVVFKGNDIEGRVVVAIKRSSNKDDLKRETGVGNYV
jgi:Leucine Rich repeat